MNNTLKVCAKCRQIKLKTNFGTDKTHKNGLQSWCRSCKAAWARQYYATTKGKLAHNRSRRQYTEQQQTSTGFAIANMLGLKRKDGRYHTTWGTKTDLGLYLSVKRIMDGV